MGVDEGSPPHDRLLVNDVCGVCMHVILSSHVGRAASEFTRCTPHTEMQKWPHIVVCFLQCLGGSSGELAAGEDGNTKGNQHFTSG